MKKENLKLATDISEAIEHHEDFISHCDFFIRNTTRTEIPALDRWLKDAVEASVVNYKDLIHLVTDLRDIATTKLAELDKKLEAL